MSKSSASTWLSRTPRVAGLGGVRRRTALLCGTPTRFFPRSGSFFGRGLHGLPVLLQGKKSVLVDPAELPAALRLGPRLFLDYAHVQLVRPPLLVLEGPGTRLLHRRN